MIPTEPPSPDTVLADLADFMHCLRRAIEAGLVQANRYLEQYPGANDQHLLLHMVRFHAVRRLGVELEEADVESDRLAMSGMQFRITGGKRLYTLRVRRSTDGEVPPASTRALANFYQQASLPLVWEPGETLPTGTPLNLVVLWNSSRQGTSVDQLTIVCPESVDDREPLILWRRVVTMPAIERVAPAAEAAEESVDIPIDDVEDIRTKP